MVSEYLLRPLRELCTKCKARPGEPATGLCLACAAAENRVICFICKEPMNDPEEHALCDLEAIMAGLGA